MVIGSKSVECWYLFFMVHSFKCQQIGMSKGQHLKLLKKCVNTTQRLHFVNKLV